MGEDKELQRMLDQLTKRLGLQNRAVLLGTHLLQCEPCRKLQETATKGLLLHIAEKEKEALR